MPLLQLELKFADLVGKIEKLIIEVTQCREGMDYMNKNFEDMRSDLNLITENHKKILEENNGIKLEIKEMKKEINKLKMHIDSSEKEKLSFGLEISLVPETKAEDLHDIIGKISKLVKYEVPKSSIKTMYRKKTKIPDKIGDIVICMSSKDCRNGFLKAIKARRPKAEDLGFLNVKNPIFVKELLTDFGKELYYKALQFRKENNWKFLWISDGSVLIREKEGARYHVIKTLDDIAKLKG